MKLSEHYINDVLPKRPYLTEELLVNIINKPIRVEIQSNKRMKLWGYSSKFKKFVRIVLLEDGETILTAFFDRNFKI